MKTKSTIHIDITYLHKYVVYRLFIHGIYVLYNFKPGLNVGQTMVEDRGYNDRAQTER